SQEFADRRPRGGLAFRQHHFLIQAHFLTSHNVNSREPRRDPFVGAAGFWYCWPSITPASSLKIFCQDSSMGQATVPRRAWVVTFAGPAVNLCLGILYTWSVWKANLIATVDHPAGSPMTGRNEGWTYLTDAQGTWAYAVCGFVFALFMIPGGRLQDKFGP